ncbi:MAG: hypothetical protein H7836_04785 [Magnetococcus sp. YQC-3]
MFIKIKGHIINLDHITIISINENVIIFQQGKDIIFEAIYTTPENLKVDLKKIEKLIGVTII